MRPNYGERLNGKNDAGKNKLDKCITNLVIRFFPKGRYSERARVRRWAKRNLLAESNAGRTRANRNTIKARYSRNVGQMSAYSSMKERQRENNWLLAKLGQTVSYSSESKNFGSSYIDIPRNHVLHALRTDLSLRVEGARARGANVKRARSLWVGTAAQVLAARHEDHRPLPHHLSDAHVTHYDGFTDLWRRAGRL